MRGINWRYRPEAQKQTLHSAVTKQIDRQLGQPNRERIE
jgi:hypothetical protein